MSIQSKLASDPRYDDAWETITKHSSSAFVVNSFSELAGLLADVGHDTPLWRDIRFPKNHTDLHGLSPEAATIRIYQRRLLYHFTHSDFDSTQIHLQANQQELGGRVYEWEDTAIKISFDEKVHKCVCHKGESNPFATITIGNNCQSGEKQAFLDLKGNEKDGIIELDEFVMLSRIGNSKDGEIGIYTAFSKKHNLLFTEFVTGSPSLRETRLSLKAGMLDGSGVVDTMIEMLFGLLKIIKTEDDEQAIEIQRLKTELAQADDNIVRQREEVRRLTDELFKENKDAIKPYASEISELNNRIRELEKNLETEQAKTPELNALREFAFAVQSEYIPPETTITLAELTKGKRIIIVGGHINWRNKMKERYPAIMFLDGHNASLDVSIFGNADFTLLYTSNMSHKLYYKIIGYLRDKKLRFNYLGRSINQELLETEIVSILQGKIAC